MMSPKFLFTIGVIAALQITTSQAQAQDGDIYISCVPRVPYIGEATSIAIKKGSIDAMPAEFTQGMHGNITTASYVVKKTESDDLNIEFYTGKGISLTVDLAKNAADLTAVVSKKIVKLSDLICTFNENDSNPGVKMGS